MSKALAFLTVAIGGGIIYMTAAGKWSYLKAYFFQVPT